MRKRLDPAKTREHILSAAAHCFAAEGFAASIGDIANKAGVPKSLVQYHFGTKEDLWSEVCGQESGPLMETLEKVASGEANVADLLAVRFKHFARDASAVRMIGWAALQESPMPKHIKAKAHLFKQMVADHPEHALTPLMLVFAMDGFFQNRRIFARAVGEHILTKEYEVSMRENMLRICRRWQEEQAFLDVLSEAVRCESN